MNINTQNYLFVIKDPSEQLTTGPNHEVVKLTDLAKFKTNCGATATIACKSLLDTGFSANGWKIPLTHLGEKAMSSPTTLNGTVLFTSYVPSTGGSCKPTFGHSRLYAINLLTAEPTLFADNDDQTKIYHERSKIVGEGLPTTPQYLRSGTFVVGNDSGGSSSGTGKSTNLFTLNHRTTWPIYWRRRVGH